MLEHKKPKTGIWEHRTFEAQIKAINENSRTVELSFSSELPYDRWFGPEILSHDEEAVDLSRLLEVGTVLFAHGRDPNLGKMPIAKIEKAWVDTKERKGRAQITFDDDEDSDRIFQKVNKGIIKGVSVGYSVSNWEEVAAGKKSANGRFTGPAYIAIKWEPIEISIEPTPADPSVGVGRNADEVAAPVDGRADKTIPEKEEKAMYENEKKEIKTPEAVNESAAREEAVKAERQRVSEITAMCRDFDVDPKEYIEKGSTVDQVRVALLGKAKEKMKPITASGGVQVERDEADKFREAASDAILIRAGRTIEKPVDGARDLRGMTLRDLAIECLVRTGRANAHRLDNDTLFREALAPDSQFASILSNAVNKTMATAYRTAQTTYQRWTSRGSNPDFKAVTHYQISEAGDLVQMTQSGEFKFDEMQDLGVNKAIATFGREFGMTRQALINDDIGVLTRVPEAYVRAARRGINRLVYRMLGTNPVIFDGLQLFVAAHNNLAAQGANITVASVGAGRAAMRTQRNLRGNEILNIGPKFLIVPAAWETEGQQFLSATLIPTQQNVVNPFVGTLELVADAELDALVAPGNPFPWFLAADPADVDTIEVTYLNGDDMPKLESQVGFDFLGIKWRIYIDYGVTVLDYRGLYMNAGT
ncbi:MAG: hypothetical protein QHH10_08230 [Peptococcaceae bacterium]|jgi:hypothetical protein|nr:Mu-like prophage major head subunit gpT family protein [Peptococcaceae bacterium]MDH7525281.1 hypothetical protein [Peptococcaceae bacterium]